MSSDQPDAVEPKPLPRTRMSVRTRIIFFVVAWSIVLLPFMFWRSTWFGLDLSDQKITQYLHDEKSPRHIQHALVQLAERKSRNDDISRWYPDVVRVSSHPREEIRNTAAWVMGQDNTRPEFHDALRKLLDDSSPTVRGNAALALVRFNDPAGRPQIRALLEPATITAPAAAKVLNIAKPGNPIRQGTVVAQLEINGQPTDVRAPNSGQLENVRVQDGEQVAAGAALATVTPGTEQVWEALRALYIVGQPEDLDLVRRFTHDSPRYPENVPQQARETERAILDRAKAAPSPK